MSVSFTTSLRQAQSKNATGIVVPIEVVEKLAGGKAPLVIVTVNGYVYRGKIAVYDGECLIGFSGEHRKASGIQGGETIEVILELDLKPRVTEIPDDLKEALTSNEIPSIFEKAAPSRQKEFVRQVNEAKTEETRVRRIAKIISELMSSKP